MITLPLRMRYGEKPLRQPAAWLIPGAEPRIWLDEMLAWGVPLGDAVLYQIPRSASDLSPQGVLVVLPAGFVPRVTHRSQPYAALVVPPLGGSSLVFPPGHHVTMVGGDLFKLPPTMGTWCPGGTTNAAHVVYLPVDARMDPDASDAEVAELAADLGDCILHPALGRICLEPSDRRRVVDLLARPRQRPARWDLAEPGQRVNSRLTAILPAEVPSLELMLDQGRDDIGSDSPTLDELPPQPDEPSTGFFSKLGRGLQRKLAEMIDKLAAASGACQAPPQAGAGQDSAGPGMLSKMANWARQKIAYLDDSLRQSRHRELHRLMHLLENDPDQGLRFALPCGEGKHRGIAPPSGKLPGRNVNFDLRRLGGGARSDPWELPGDLYAQLRARYMELAGREMRLGRYRRAAYVYAHLLGDFTNAAAALIAGKHWREAAALYRDRLKRPEMAAKCLEQGGLWAEAIEFYEQLNDFEKVGDLHAQLDQPEEAAKAWRRAVEKHLERQDRIAAAQLLETKLQSPDEALEVLVTGWHASAQAGACLAAQFALLGRLGRHEAAQRRVAEIRQERLSESLRKPAIDILVENATGYPHEAVRAAAADATRTVLARHLREATGPELEHLLESLRRLAPSDRLLDRDTARYLRNRARPPRPVAKVTPSRRVIPAPHSSPELKRLESIALPGGVMWECAVSRGDHFYAAGYRDRSLCLVQNSWNGKTSVQQQSVSQPLPILLAIDPHHKEEGVLHLVGGPRVSAVRFVSSDIFFQPCVFASSGWLPELAVGVAFGANGTKHVLVATDDGHALNTLDTSASPIRSQPVSSLWPGERVSRLPELPVPMSVRDAGVYVGLGDWLSLVTGEKTSRTFEMPGTVHSLCGSAPYSVGRVVATLEQGAALFWEKEQTIVRLDEELNRPVAAFTDSGWIVLASSEAVHVYATEDRTIRLAARQERHDRPVAVLPTAHPDGFAIVNESGAVELFQMPRR